jgi:hypothetical protein
MNYKNAVGNIMEKLIAMPQSNPDNATTITEAINILEKLSAENEKVHAINDGLRIDRDNKSDYIADLLDEIDELKSRWEMLKMGWGNLVKLWCVLEATNDTEDYFKFRTRFMEFDIKMQELSSSGSEKCDICGIPKDSPNYAYHVCVKRSKPKRKKWVEHIIEEGLRNHVISYVSVDGHGIEQCSVPDCEINKPIRKGAK